MEDQDCGTNASIIILQESLLLMDEVVDADEGKIRVLATYYGILCLQNYSQFTLNRFHLKISASWTPSVPCWISR